MAACPVNKQSVSASPPLRPSNEHEIPGKAASGEARSGEQQRLSDSWTADASR